MSFFDLFYQKIDCPEAFAESIGFHRQVFSIKSHGLQSVRL